MQSVYNDIFNNIDFEKTALELFHKQAESVKVYKTFIENLNIDSRSVDSIEKIPFLPVEFFKNFNVYCGGNQPEIIFTSSSTTNTGQSRHLVSSIELYKKAFTNSFSHFFGDPQKYCFLFLLPSYLEREGSSLVFMAQELINVSSYKQSGFYLYDFQDLYNQLLENEKQKIPTILFGVTFALLDFAEEYQLPLKSTVIIETGGMKGRKREIVREEVHQILSNAFGLKHIYSEYGMAELLSQAYSKGDGLFSTPPWMRVLLYNTHNPLALSQTATGGINIIDLANQHSCAFIQTADIGRFSSNNQFEVLGRLDYSEIRGCSLLAL